jgi:FAD-dependent urate hydroxylase
MQRRLPPPCVVRFPAHPTSQVAATGSSIERRAIEAPEADVAVVGAGPYGLSVAAKLRSQGASTLTFGEPMSFWDRHMPAGMWMRSAWGASSLGDPNGPLTLDAYDAEQPERLIRPLPRERFVHYGLWFQSHAVPDVDRRMVASVERRNGCFELELDDEERVRARRVVIATGLRRFAKRPSQFDALPESLAVHAVDLTEFDDLQGRSIAVVGSGQSAVETAALAHEAGAHVELIARASLIRWLARGERLRGITPLVRRVLYAPTDVGPAGLSWIMANPLLFRRLPVEPRERMAYRSIRPAATGWLIDRSTGVKLTLARQVKVARPADGQPGVDLELDDGSRRRVEKVVLATGYKVDTAREPAISAAIREQLELHEGYPLLGAGLESSIPGLHFVGAYSAWSFGPIMRFVSGTWFTSRAIARHLAR